MTEPHRHLTDPVDAPECFDHACTRITTKDAGVFAVAALGFLALVAIASAISG